MTRPAPASLVAAAPLVLSLVLAACSSPGASSPVADTSSRSGGPTAHVAVAPCPSTVADAAAVPGGLPDLTLRCLDPGSGPTNVRLPGLRGRPTVLNIWGSWCVPCREEMPVLADAARASGSRVRFLGVDVEDDDAAGRTFAAAVGVPYNSVVDSEGTTKSALRWVGPPVTVFYTADGREAGRHIGEIKGRAELDALVRQYLGVDLG